MKIGLVLEGGAMRGIYTTGILDCFLDHGITFDYVIGVSAGACNAISFVAGQRGRSYRINTRFLRDKRYLGLCPVLRERSLFGMEFLFGEMTSTLEPFDFAAFHASPTECVVVTTDADTGRPAYFGKEDMHDDLTPVRASSSIPCCAPAVLFHGRRYFDGGIADPLPVRRAVEDGCTHLVVVRTRPAEDRSQALELRSLYTNMFRQSPLLVEAIRQRHAVYYDTLDWMAMQGAEILQIAPRQPLSIGLVDRDPCKLRGVARLGYDDALAALRGIAALQGG